MNDFNGKAEKMDTQKALEVAVERVEEAIRIYEPSHVFGMFSGGFDSLCATYVASQASIFSGAVHINTGIGIEETRQYVRKTSEDLDWNLKEYFPQKKSYDELVHQFGFPGPAMHSIMYRWLKEKSVAALIREHKTHRFDRILLITGVRSQESIRRMGNVELYQRDGSTVWVAPILDWNKLDTRVFAEEFGLPENEVVNTMHMSGECLCGAFAKKNELETVRTWYPETAKKIEELQKSVEAAGQKKCKWGWKSLPGDNEQPNQPSPAGPLCHGCDK